MFFKAEPPITGTNLFAIVWRRMPAFNNLRRNRFLFENDLGDFVVDVRNLLDQIVIGLVYSLDMFLAGYQSPHRSIQAGRCPNK